MPTTNKFDNGGHQEGTQFADKKAKLWLVGMRQPASGLGLSKHLVNSRQLIALHDEADQLDAESGVNFQSEFGDHGAAQRQIVKVFLSDCVADDSGRLLSG